MLRLPDALYHLLCRSRNGCRDAALLHYVSYQLHHHARHLPGALLPPQTPLLHILAFSTSSSLAGHGGNDPSASPSRRTTILPSMVDYLIRSYGFSPHEASTVMKRLNRSKTTGNPESVLSFFKGKGLDDALIRKVVLVRPYLLYADVEKTLAPKFRTFEEMGFTGSDMPKILARNSSLISNSVEKKLIPNISLLREECGISGQRLLRFLRRSSRAVGRSANSLKEIIERVRELGIRHGSAAFDTALHITDSLSRSMVDERLTYFKSLGWREEDILSAIRRVPLILGLSKRKVDEKLVCFKSLGWMEEETFSAIQRNPVILLLSERKIKDSTDFFMKEAGCSISVLAANPILLGFSIEKRVKPRYHVYQILQFKHLPEGNWSLPYIVSLAEKKFLDKVILKYMDRFPELNKAYGASS